MGTNFYLSNGKHVGKRSAAGSYCPDCKLTLCKGGVDAIHKGKAGWHTSCPQCAKDVQYLPTACSFTWAVQPTSLIGKNCNVRDEYGQAYRMKDFGKMVNEIPFHFLHSVGQEFS